MQSNNGNARARYYWHDLKALIDGATGKGATAISDAAKTDVLAVVAPGAETSTWPADAGQWAQHLGEEATKANLGGNLEKAGLSKGQHTKKAKVVTLLDSRRQARLA